MKEAEAPFSSGAQLRIKPFQDCEKKIQDLANRSNAVPELWAQLSEKSAKQERVTMTEIRTMLKLKFARLSAVNLKTFEHVFTKTTGRSGSTVNGSYLLRGEFKAFIVNLFYAAKLWACHGSATGWKELVSFESFVRGIAVLGINRTFHQSALEFEAAQGSCESQQNVATLADFAVWLTETLCPGGALVMIDTAPKDGDRASWAKLEETIKEIIESPEKASAIWNRVDYNDDSIVSLDEFERLFTSNFVLLKNHNAVVRSISLVGKLIASQNSDSKNHETSDKDLWVQRGEFLALITLHYYLCRTLAVLSPEQMELSYTFDHSSLVELCSKLSIDMNENNASKVFESISQQGGDVDSFALWFASRRCPSGLVIDPRLNQVYEIEQDSKAGL